MDSRSFNAKRNSFWGIINKMVMMIFPFCIRAATIYFVGVKYLGISSLFTSILHFLNVAELGIGNAIVYSMYKPVADNNKEQICALLGFYKTVYRIIGLLIFVLGLCLIPFLPMLIKTELAGGLNVYVLYIMYLFNSAVSYWLFSYRKCLLHAHQREDVLSKMHMIMHILLNVLQLFILVAFKNYYIFVLVLPVTTICQNLITGYITAKMFPEYKPVGKLKKEEINEIKKQVVGLSAMRIATISRDSLDSVVVSAFLGLTAVAMHSNYFYILSAVASIMAVLTNSIAAGIGNSIAYDSIEKNYEDIRKLNMAYMSLAGVCAVGLVCLYQPFMKLWVGENMVLPNGIMALYVVYFYVARIPGIAGKYLDSAGLWWKGKWKCFIETGVNFVLNIVLGYKFGIAGIIAATIISATVVNIPITFVIVFKNYFGKSCREFYKDHIVMLAANGIAVIGGFFLCRLLPEFDGTIGMLAGLCLCGIVALGVWVIAALLLYGSYGEYRKSIHWLKVRLIKR